MKVAVAQIFGRVQFGTSIAATANGTIQKTTVSGLTVLGVAGSSYDFALYNPSGASPILLNPTGTVNLVFSGNVAVTGTTAHTGNIAIGTTGQIALNTSSSSVSAALAGGTFGAGAITGSVVSVGNNSSGGGAAGLLALVGKGSASNYLWADASGTPGVLRISTAPPEEDGAPSDTSGTVVGAQTSTLDTKRVLGAGVTPSQALAVMLRTPTFQFVYKGGSYSGTVFQGIAADLSPEFAMDPDAAHPNGRSFNPVNALGYTVQAIKALEAEIEALRSEVRALQSSAGGVR